MEKPVRTYKKGNEILKIYQDSDTESPREGEDLGTMVCWHRSYDLGDKHSYSDPDEFRESLNEKDICLSLFLMDHSGISMSTESYECKWDSGQVGYIVLSHEKAIKEYGENYDRKKIEEYLKSEVKTYDQYLTGDIYGFQLVELEKCSLGHEHENELDSCWNFYGRDFEENGLIDHTGIDDIEKWEMKE